MGDASVWLSCEDERTGQSYGEASRPHLLRGTWGLEYTQAAAAVIWPHPEDFDGANDAAAAAAKEEAGSAAAATAKRRAWKPPTPPCPYNTLHIQMNSPQYFLVIGHAES